MGPRTRHLVLPPCLRGCCLGPVAVRAYGYPSWTWKIADRFRFSSVKTESSRVTVRSDTECVLSLRSRGTSRRHQRVDGERERKTIRRTDSTRSAVPSRREEKRTCESLRVQQQQQRESRRRVSCCTHAPFVYEVGQNRVTFSISGLLSGSASVR